VSLSCAVVALLMLLPENDRFKEKETDVLEFLSSPSITRGSGHQPSGATAFSSSLTKLHCTVSVGRAHL